MNRKNFIKNLFVLGLAFFGGSFIFSSCGDDKKKEEIEKQKGGNQLNCGENLSEVEQKSRDEYNYEEASTHEDKVCTNCTHWRIPKKGEQCGTCELVKGPINPLGYCDQWMEAPHNIIG